MDPDTGTPACHLPLGAWAAKDGTGTVCNGTAGLAIQSVGSYFP